MDTMKKFIQIVVMVRMAEEMNIDISKDLAPLKSYTGNNQHLLDLKAYCEARGML